MKNAYNEKLLLTLAKRNGCSGQQTAARKSKQQQNFLVVWKPIF
jgi:hypothetical protein